MAFVRASPMQPRKQKVAGMRSATAPSYSNARALLRCWSVRWAWLIIFTALSLYDSMAVWSCVGSWLFQVDSIVGTLCRLSTGRPSQDW